MKKKKETKKKKRTVNREHKDRLFKKLFGSAENKANMLSLYNALNESSYTDESQLQIYTIDDAVFLGMKNDVGYVLDSYISLHEQQSTYNPNMPLRGLFYHTKMYEKYIAKNAIDLNTTELKKIPTPQFYVFYNGDKPFGDRTELKLSDAFIQPVKEGIFEWTAVMLNINKGHNSELLQKCETLNNYATFIDKIKEYTAEGHSIEDAVITAVDWCIKNGILDTYLKVHKSEVIGMILTEYNEKQTMENIRKEAYAEGRNEGRNEGRQEMMVIVEKERAKAEEERTRANNAESRISELEAEIARLKNK